MFDHYRNCTDPPHTAALYPGLPGCGLPGWFLLIFVLFDVQAVPSVLWHCWLGGRKGIRPVENWVVGWWRGYLSGARCGLPGWAGTKKVKPVWISLKQETVSGSGISWAICKSPPCSRQTTTPAPHHCFLQTGCPSCRPTNSVKALKAYHTAFCN